MAGRNDVPVAFGVPRVPPGVAARPRLNQLLDRHADLTVITGARGRGKTTLVAQWLTQRKTSSESVVWVDLASTWRHGKSPWISILEALDDAGLINAEDVAREVAVLSQSTDGAVRVMRRSIAGFAQRLLLVLDGNALERDTATQQWEDQLVEVLLAVPDLHCVVMGRSHEALSAPGVRARLNTVAIDGDMLALTESEAAAIIASHDHDIDEATGLRLQRIFTGGSPSELRYLLVLLDTVELDLVELARGEISTEVASMVRRDLPGMAADHAGWLFMGLISFAPVVTPALAVTLTRDAGAERVLDAWVRAGMGHWTTLPRVGRVFRLSELVRTSASADLVRDHPEEANRARRITATWLLDEAHDPLGALQEAIKADDLDLVERALLPAFPLRAVEGRDPKAWIDAIPAHRIHRHPLLALQRALELNASPSSQAQAVEYFQSATAMGRRGASRTGGDEPVIRLGMETLTWRMLGQENAMVQAARTCVDVAAAGTETSGIDQIAARRLWAIHQSATSLMWAGLAGQSRTALDVLERASLVESADRFVALARAGRAMLEVIDGDVNTARATLASIASDAWPDTWKNTYMEAQHVIAQAWVDLNEGEPERLLERMNNLKVAGSTNEYWDVITEVKTYALVLLGRTQEAGLVLRQARHEHENPKTFTLARSRLDTAEMVLGLFSAAVPDGQRREISEISRSPRHAIAVLGAVAIGDPDRATAAVLEAEATVRCTLDRAFVAVAGIAVGNREDKPELLQRYAAQLSMLVRDEGIALVTALMTQEERGATLETLRRMSASQTMSAHEPLQAAFEVFAPFSRAERTDAVEMPDLTHSERALLILLATQSTRVEIARERFVSVNTIKTQLRSLYSKLGVSTRDDAVSRAVAWGLITPEHSA